MTIGRGRHGQLFLNGLGLSLGAKIVSTNDRPSTFSIIFRLFFQAGAKNKMRRILYETVGGTPRRVRRFFHAKKKLFIHVRSFPLEDASIIRNSSLYHCQHKTTHTSKYTYSPTAGAVFQAGNEAPSLIRVAKSYVRTAKHYVLSPVPFALFRASNSSPSNSNKTASKSPSEQANPFFQSASPHAGNTTSLPSPPSPPSAFPPL